MVTSALPSNEQSYKVKIAMKYGIPVVSVDFISACVDQKRILSTDNYIVFGDKSSFSCGKIASLGMFDELAMSFAVSRPILENFWIHHGIRF